MNSYFGYSRKRFNNHEKLEYQVIKRAKKELLFANPEEEFDIICDTVDKLRIIKNSRYLKSVGETIPKSTAWFMNVVPNYDDRRFRAIFRVSKESFMQILHLIDDFDIFKSSKRKQIPVLTQLAITLARMGHFGDGSSYTQIAKDFGVSDGGAVMDSTKRVVTALLTLKQKYVKWPNSDHREIISHKMSRKGFPFCIGFVDGTHVKLEFAPKDDSKSYYNRKNFYSIQVQLTCDPDKRIINSLVGFPGCVHDAKVFRECRFNKYAETYFSGHQYLIGDGAYKLQPFMLSPFRREENMASDEETFNAALSGERIRIEHVNGILKSRFQSLFGLRITVDKKNRP